MKVYEETGMMFAERTKPKRKTMDWYKHDGKYDSVLFVEATPESELKKMTERLVKKHKLKILVVERAGGTTCAVLQKSDPFRHHECGRDRCVTCRKGSGIDCRARGIIYQFECKENECGRKYRGTTGRSVFERVTEQVNKWSSGDDECPLRRHSVLFHEERQFEFEVKVLRNCYGKPSRRMITEAVYIDELKDDETMNSKHEWSFTKLDKVQVT
jgi:hypothetical protein